ncbi:membrane protein insertion efficiency factor YidD [Hydrogenimonas sp.]
MVRKALSAPVRFYQKYLTLLGFGSCRYYPTCSEYAKWQIETNPNLFSALFASALRILRCNQLFDGGIDYPVISCKPFSTTSRRCGDEPVKIRYWFVPQKGKCRVIKNTFSKGPSC